MSNVPRAVRKQAEKAKQLHDQMYGKGQDTGNEPTPQQQSDSQQTAEPQPAAPQQPADGGDSFEAKFKTLQGKYNAEVPRLQEKIRELEQRLKDSAGAADVNNLKAQNEQLQQQVQQQKQQLEATKKELDKARSALTDEFGEAVTDDFAALARGTAEEAARNATAEATQAQKQECTRRIVDAIKDFPAINDSPEFNRWLDEAVDDETGLPMREIVQRTYDRADDIQFIRYVRRFLKQQEATDDPMHNQPKQTAGGMDDLVAPPRGNQQRQPQEKPSFTSAHYKQHLEEKTRSNGFTRGMWAGREADWKAHEQVILAAINR